MMTTRKRGGARDHKSNREAKGNEEYDYNTYYGDENYLRISLFENEKQQLESRISILESRNKAVECKNTALIVSIIVLLIVTLTIMTILIIHQLNFGQLNTEIIDLKNVEQSRIISGEASFELNPQEREIDVLKKKIESLDTRGYWCAFQNGPWTSVSTITYDYLTFSFSNNMEITKTPLDINSGNSTSDIKY